MQRHIRLKCAALALALCFNAPQVMAQTGEKILSGAATAHDTAVDALKGIKKFKPSDFKMALGNNATRKVWANWVNGKIDAGLKISTTAHLPAVSTALEAAGSGAELLGHLYEGDATGAGTVVLHSAVSNVTVAGGALAGGKLFAYVGAVAGAWVPVVGPVAGSVVGGVVGSVGGAVVSSVAIGSDAVKDWFSATTESFFARDKAWYSNLARQNRDDFLAEQAQQAAIAKGEHEKARAAREYGYDVPAGSSDNSEIQFSAGKLPDVELPATAESDPGKGIPSIPPVATLEITSWVNPAFTGTEKFILNNGAVSAYYNGPVPIAPEYYTSGHREGAFKGRIEANTITGTWSDSFQYTFAKHPCSGPMYIDHKTNIEITLNNDGTITGKIIGGTENIKVIGCPSGANQHANTIPENALQGRWKFYE